MNKPILISAVLSAVFGVVLTIYIPFILMIITGLLFAIGGGMIVLKQEKEYVYGIYTPAVVFLVIILISTLL